MPRSEEKNVGKNIERLAHSHPEFGQKQRIAVAESESRRAGGDAPAYPKGKEEKHEKHEKHEEKHEERKKKADPKKSYMRAQVMRSAMADNGEA
jgi:hypothetical protein